MINNSSRIRLGTGIALLAGMAILSGCGPAPYSHTSTSEKTTTTTPAPVMSTTTTTTEQNSQNK